MAIAAIASRQERYEIEHQKRLTLYRMGMTDAQMAAALQLSLQTIRSWRRRESLAPNRAPKRSGAAQPAPANHPWRDRRQVRREPMRPAAPTVDAVARAAATCDAMAAARSAGHRTPTDFDPVITVDIKSGTLTVHNAASWWPVWRGRTAS